MSLSWPGIPKRYSGIELYKLVNIVSGHLSLWHFIEDAVDIPGDVGLGPVEAVAQRLRIDTENFCLDF
jgi:hypothetical protein